MENSDLLAALDARFSRIDVRFDRIETALGSLKEDTRGLKEDTRGFKEDTRGLKEDIRSLKEATSNIWKLLEEQRTHMQLLVDGIDNANDRLVRFQSDVASEFKEARAFNELMFRHLVR